MRQRRELSCAAKLVHVVLENQGPLSPAEVADEAHLCETEAERAICELRDAELVECVCGVCATREEVYALTQQSRAPET